MSNAILRAGDAPRTLPPLRDGVFREIEAIQTGNIALSYENAVKAAAEAQEEAEQIRRDAEAEAIRIIAEATAEAGDLREAARAQGYADGSARAEEEARIAIEEGIKIEAASLREDMETFCEAVLLEQERVWRDIEGQLKDLAMEIAERVLKAELTVNPDVVVQITQHAMRRLADKDQVRIRVNPDDVERLRDHREEIMRLFEGLRSVEILEDRRVGIGGVQIETDTGMVDARIETQMHELTRALDV